MKQINIEKLALQLMNAISQDKLYLYLDDQIIPFHKLAVHEGNILLNTESCTCCENQENTEGN